MLFLILCFITLDQKVSFVTGTDTGGSVRVPASYCGILGFRPSHGVVSTTGVIPMAQSFDTVGKETSSLRNLKAFWPCLAGTQKQRNRWNLWLKEVALLTKGRERNRDIQLCVWHI